MRISGNNINTFDVFINNFTSKYIAALKWVQVANGNWKNIDRLNISDQYETTIRITSNETNIDKFLEEIETNRQYDNLLSLSNFNSIEKIFGANIDYSSNDLTVAVLKIGDKKQKNIGVYSIKATMKLLTDLDTTGLFNAGSSFPTLKIFRRYDIKTNRTIKYLQTYNNITFFQDRKSDYGVLSIDCIMDHNDMSLFRNFVRTNRGASFSLSAIDGISKPFGINTSWPVNVRIRNFKDSLIDLKFWKCSIDFVQEN